MTKDTERSSVLIEPDGDDATRRVRKKLDAIGSTKVEELTPGFISAEIPTAEIENLQRLARVNVVKPKQYR